MVVVVLGGDMSPFFHAIFKRDLLRRHGNRAHTETERAVADGLIWPDRDASASWSLRAARSLETGASCARRSHIPMLLTCTNMSLFFSNSFQLSVKPELIPS